MPIEKRTRVEVFLPLRSDIPAYQVAIDWLSEEFALERGGATLTTPFAGLFVSPEQVDVVEDAVRVLHCDFELDADNLDDRAEIVSHLENVKEFLRNTLDKEEIWIIFYPISRVVS
ncbi:MAG: hypothetical protein ACRD6X_06340 [Pyrinomonadaceae bacterium]